jgi:hypothetical protein
MIANPHVPQRKREDEELHLEHKKAQLDDTKKISIDNSHAAAVDTSELVAEMMVCESECLWID